MNTHSKWILRYSNCWEDADLLIKYISTHPGKKLLSVASGGDNSLSLLLTNPAEVVVVDINPIQLYLFELKVAAISLLDRNDFLQFTGFQNSSKNKRRIIYRELGSKISKEAKLFWDTQKQKIEKGVIHSGYIERNIRFFARFLRPLLHSERSAKELMRYKTAEAQKIFYEDKWNNRRWRTLYHIFFSEPALRLIGPDNTFFNYASDSVTRHLQQQIKSHFSSVKTQQNHMLHYVLFGTFGNMLPLYVQEGNYELIKERLHRLSVRMMLIEDLVSTGETFDGFNLSNIFDYTKPEEFKWFAEVLAQGGNRNARYIYWNALQIRKLSVVSDKFKEELDSSGIKDFPDRGITYSRMCVDLKN